jgi:anaerobic magnesium-protoporphyrin IX monomethyl ester cyclase
MKILFINPNRNADYGKPPLGILSVATVCKRAGYDVTILDDTISKLSEFELLTLAQDVDVVGISAMTPTYDRAIQYAMSLKAAYPDKKIVLGGVHASIFPNDILPIFDTVVAGEGEDLMLELLKDLEAGKLRRVYRQAYEVNMDSLPLPDYSLIGVDNYKPHYPHGKYQPWTAATTSRGCPFQCTFCSKAVFGSHFRGMSPQKVAYFLLNLTGEYGVKDITFYDDLFTFDKKRVLDICRLIQENSIKVSWTCEARVNGLDEEMLDMMASSGCRMIYFGIEAGCQKILDKLCKGTKLTQIRQAVRMCKETGIEAAAYFMLGCPGETRETMSETLNFAESLELNHAQFSVCSPLPGSNLYQDYIKVAGKPTDWSSFQYLAKGKKPMFLTDGLTPDDIEAAVESANRRFA